MSDHQSDMSSVKLGLLVAWFGFWTGAPIKFVIGLLFLSMGVHPWEGSGLAFLLLLSIPIDIWALGLVAKTLFLERLRLQPPASLGLTLWWQIALVSVVYFPLAYFIESGTISGAQSVTNTILNFFEGLPVAERISIELVMWTGPATVMLIVLIVGWLAIVGRLVNRQAATARPSSDSYQDLIRRWDLMRVPADQPLLLTVFLGAGIFLVIAFWGFLPASTPHPHEDYEMPDTTVKAFKPAEELENVEKVIAQAELAVRDLEKKSGKSSKGQTRIKKGNPPSATSGTEAGEQAHDDGKAHQH